MAATSSSRSAARRRHSSAHRPVFNWNWRMVILGVLLNLATIAIVIYTVSLLNDYRQCILQQTLSH